MARSDVTVAMPWRATPDRLPAFERCTRFWTDHGFRIVFGDSDPSRLFNRSQARNNAVALAATGTIIVCDADVLPASIEQIELAVDIAQPLGQAVTPYSTYRLLPADAVDVADLSTVVPVREYKVSARPAGITVITRDSYDMVGGYDEKFGSGWGYEDNAFILACETLLVGVHRLDGVLYAFDHPGSRRRDTRNRKRHWWYQRAYGDPVQMRLLTKRQ